MKVALAPKKIFLWVIGLLVFFVWIGMMSGGDPGPFAYPDGSGLLMVYLVLLAYSYMYRKITIDQINNKIIEKNLNLNSNILDEDLSELEDLGL